MATPSRTINCFASFGKNELLRPWQYESRPLYTGDIEVKISHCGICGSDIHSIDSGWGQTNYPCVAGHEIVGEVTQIGSDVTEHAVGDRVGVGAQVLVCFNKNPDAPCRECASGEDGYCDHVIGAYDYKYEDGALSRGGYAEYVRVSGTHAFKIPENISSAEAAPLLCAGVTVYKPLKEAGVKPGDRVGVIGIGGLGHLAIQFAKALGATPVAFSRSASKEAEVRALGAEDFVNTSDPEQMQSAMGSVDVLIITADADNMPYNQYLGFTRKRGTCVMVALPNDQVQFFPMYLIARGIKFAGSFVGSTSDIKAMLKLASEKDVRPVIQTLPMSEVNKGLDMVRKGTVRYRMVLENW